MRRWWVDIEVSDVTGEASDDYTEVHNFALLVDARTFEDAIDIAVAGIVSEEK